MKAIWLLPCSRRADLLLPLFIFIAFTSVAAHRIAAQDIEPPPMRLDGVQPGGVRRSATESWGAFDFQITNISDIDRQARVVMFYEGEPEVQYGRELWIPANSVISTWMLTGPASNQQSGVLRDIQMLLYDRTGGQDLLMLPRTEERFRTRGVLYRKREPTTAILLEDRPLESPSFGRLPAPDTAADEAVRLVRTLRSAVKLSASVIEVNSSHLPPNPEAFGGIDHFVLASRRILDDPSGLQALRRWTAQGGKLWVMLDLVDLDVVAPFLGDALDFQIADRISLTSFRIAALNSGNIEQPKLQHYDRAVTFTRVLLPRGERPIHTIDGWPVWFTRPFGRGKIVFTALGPRGWHRPRVPPRDPPSPFELYPDLPFPDPPLQRFAEELNPPKEEDTYRAELFRPWLIDEIGFAVPNRTTVAWIFAAFAFGALVLGLLLRRAGWPTLQGWLAPTAALIVGIGFFAAGEWSRRAAVPTVAVAQIVEPAGGTDDSAVHGVLAAYRSDSGPAEPAGDHGGAFELDMAAMEGQARRYVQTDLDRWKWENLSLPGGIRFAPFRFTASMSEPISAVARFGPEGIEGRLMPGPFQAVQDALVTGSGGRNMAVHLQTDGSWRADSKDVLAPDLFLPNAVLTDEQQRRQELYRELLNKQRKERGVARPVLLAWAKPIDAGFHLVRDGRTVGTALLVVPIRFDRPEPGSRVAIPAPLVTWQRVLPGGLGKPTFDSVSQADQLLRFQIPVVALPLKIERVRLTAKIDALSRRVTISAGPEGSRTELHRAESPLDLIRVEIADPRLLQQDEQGGLYLNVHINDPSTLGTPQEWRIEYIDLEITGRAE
jgi:hypothetical protein